MCQHYAPEHYNECREPVAERIVDKEQANFCDFFSLGHTKSTAEEKKQSLQEAAAGLFKK